MFVRLASLGCDGRQAALSGGSRGERRHHHRLAHAGAERVQPAAGDSLHEVFAAGLCDHNAVGVKV